MHDHRGGGDGRDGAGRPKAGGVIREARAPLSVYAVTEPVVSANGATVSWPVYDSSTGLYLVTLASTQGTEATIRIAAGK
jgi:hypothetical protein